MVFHSGHDIHMLCEMNILATSDPEHHTVTAPSCLLSFTEMPMATSSHCNTPEDMNHQHY
jgi:hypothetical protein